MARQPRGSDIVSIQGPVEMVDGQLALRIPLAAGGDKLVECAKGIGRVEGDYLVIVILPWLAEKLGVFEGSHVHVDNVTGEFSIRTSTAH